MKRWTAALALLLVCLPGFGLADTWTGKVKEADVVDVEAPADGVLERFTPERGDTVRAGEIAGNIRLTRSFAPADGTVEAIHLEEGDEIDGTVLEIDPVSAYDITATAEGAPRTRENALVHSGERLYVRCTADGEHTAAGRVTAIDGESYHVEITEGALYIGETVRLYREEDYTEESCVGSGTVAASSLITCTGEGKLAELFVAEGDAVQKGQLLWTSASTGETEVVIPADGVVTGVLAARGDLVSEDGVLARIATRTILSVPAEAEDAEIFRRGTVLRYYRADDPHETLHDATVSRVLHDTSDAALTVELVPSQEGLLPIGLTVTVTDEE